MTTCSCSRMKRFVLTILLFLSFCIPVNASAKTVYYKELGSNSKLKVDLNGDKKKDTLRMKGNDYWDQKLYINNVCVLKHIGRIRVIDLNTKDKYKEVFVTSGDRKIVIYRYNKAKKFKKYATGTILSDKAANGAKLADYFFDSSSSIVLEFPNKQSFPGNGSVINGVMTIAYKGNPSAQIGNVILENKVKKGKLCANLNKTYRIRGYTTANRIGDNGERIRFDTINYISANGDKYIAEKVRFKKSAVEFYCKSSYTGAYSWIAIPYSKLSFWGTGYTDDYYEGYDRLVVK